MSASFSQEKFNEVLKKFILVTKKDAVTVVNTKAYYVARRALWGTKKTNINVIRRQLGQWRNVNRMNKDTGRMNKVRVARLVKGLSGAPLAALIINKTIGKGKSPFRGNHGFDPQKGLYGPAMAVAVERFLAGRFSSIAYLKSGWLAAIRGLDPMAESKPSGAPIDKAALKFSNPKGSFTAATAGRFIATITNSAQSKTDTKDALNIIARKALEAAMNKEREFMESHKKMTSACEKANREL